MDMSNRNLLLQYLELISEQQQIIRSLGTNLTLINSRSSDIVLQYICGLDLANHDESRTRIPPPPPPPPPIRSSRRGAAHFSRNQRRNAILFPRPVSAPNILSPPVPATLPGADENAQPSPLRLPRQPPQSPPPPPPEVASRNTRIPLPTRENRVQPRSGYDRGGMYTGDNEIHARLVTATPLSTRFSAAEGASRQSFLSPLIPRVLPPPSSTLGRPETGAQQPDNESESASPRSVDTIIRVSRSTSTNQDNIVNIYPQNAPPPRPRLRRQRAAQFVNPIYVEQIPAMEELSSPVRIRPSRHQIAAATELIRYRDLSDNYHTICPIDQQDFEPRDYILRIRHCCHIFREMNLRRHFRSSPRCPICRFDIRDHGSSAEDPITNQIVNSINQIFNSATASIANRHLPGATAEITFTATLEDPSNNSFPPPHV